MSVISVMRPYNGIGDWLMTLACLKLVNRQRPEVACNVEFSRTRGLPAIVWQAFEASDVSYSTIEPAPAAARRTTDSLVYRKYPPANYIESMLLHLNGQTGLDIEYERGVFPHFGLEHEGGDYVVMISQGKRRERHRKEWGSRNLGALAHNIAAAGFPVIQIGGRWDHTLPAARERHMGRPFSDVAAILARARAYVGLENGIMMLAGFLGVPQLTIYDGHSMPDRVDFERHLKIPERIEPPEATERVLAWLEQC